MKAKTINQINGRLQNLPTVRAYLELDYHRCPEAWSNYRNRSFVWTDGHSRTLAGNNIYSGALKEMKASTGVKQYDYSRSEVIPIGGGFGEIQVRMEIRLTGVYMTYQNHHREYLPKGYQAVKIRSNSTPGSFDLQAYAARYFAKYIPGTIIGRIMAYMNMTREQAKQKYLEIRYSTPIADRPESREELEAVALRKLLKRRNIYADPMESLNTLRRAWSQYSNSNSRHRRELRIFNPFKLYDSLTLDFDTEEEIMSEADDVISNSKIAWI